MRTSPVEAHGLRFVYVCVEVGEGRMELADYLPSLSAASERERERARAPAHPATAGFVSWRVACTTYYYIIRVCKK